MRNVYNTKNVYILPGTLFSEVPVMLMIDLQAKRKENVKAFLQALAWELENYVPIENKMEDSNFVTICKVVNPAFDEKNERIFNKKGEQKFNEQFYAVRNNIYRRLKKAYYSTNSTAGVVKFLWTWMHSYKNSEDVKIQGEDGKTYLRPVKKVPDVIQQYFTAIMQLASQGQVPCRDKELVKNYRENYLKAQDDASKSTESAAEA